MDGPMHARIRPAFSARAGLRQARKDVRVPLRPRHRHPEGRLRVGHMLQNAQQAAVQAACCLRGVQWNVVQADVCAAQVQRRACDLVHAGGACISCAEKSSRCVVNRQVDVLPQQHVVQQQHGGAGRHVHSQEVNAPAAAKGGGKWGGGVREGSSTPLYL